MGEIHRIGKANPPGVDNVIAMLEEAKGEVLRTGTTQCMVILVREDEAKDEYSNKYLNAGFKNSQMVAALRIAESDVLLEMRNNG